MEELIDRLLLLCGCVALLIFGGGSTPAVAALLSEITVSSLNGYWGKRFAEGSCLIYCLVSIWIPELLVFMPLLLYDCIPEGKYARWYPVIWLVPLIRNYASFDPRELAAVVVCSFFAVLLRMRTTVIRRYRMEYQVLRDTTKEAALHLEHKNKELMEKQDYEVRVATLHERNRIAREIHDNVGHMISRSLLQVGALMVINRESAVQDGLSRVKDTLSGAMNSIRESVHDLHDEAVDLQSQLQQLIEGFTFCPVALTYDTGDMNVRIKYCFLAVVREALSNIMRHSDATAAKVTVREHPAFYQLIIQDNGTKAGRIDESGIGIRNMQERVEAFHGTFRAGFNGGFTVFISIPKEEYQP